MTLKFKLMLGVAYSWGFLTNRDPIYVRDSSETVLTFVGKRYDPWTESVSLTASIPRRGVCKLNEDGTISDYSFMRWMYVNKSRRTMQKLQYSSSGD